MREVHLITVGALRDDQLEILEKDYSKRILNFKLSIHEVKAHAEDLEKEGREVLKKLAEISPSRKLILLKENGKKFDSPKFSKWFFDHLENSQHIVLVIGGASGHGEEVLKLTHEALSLSDMTFPHKIARLLLIEQLYRAETIFKHHPYHK